MSEDLFLKIIAGEIPADIVYENDAVLAFKDINHQAPLHVLIVPKTHIRTLNDIQPEHAGLIGEMFHAAAVISKDNGYADDGYRVVMNCNAAAGQTVLHIHLHLLAGRNLSWPPG